MKYIIGGVVLVIVVVAFIAVLISLVTSGPGAPDITESPGSTVEYLDDDSQVSYTVLGRIVGQEEFRGIRITVNDQQRTLDILEGYELSVGERLTFANTSDAFEAFMHALETAGFTETRVTEHDSEEGVCPTGRRHIYVLSADNLEEFRAWSTTCRTNLGSFGGNRSLVETLFERQIPDYTDHTRGLRL